MVERDPRLLQIEREIEGFPLSLAHEYRRATEAFGPTVVPDDLAKWAAQGLTIAQQGVRSWEAAAEYFRASPEVLPNHPLPAMVEWGRAGEVISRDSPPVAVAFFRASAASLALLRSHEVEPWGTLGQTFYKGTWKSTALACKFFEVSPALLDSLTYAELERFAGFVNALAHRSYDLAQECLVLGQEVFPRLGESRGSFISLVSTVVDAGWREVRGCFEAGGRGLPRIEESQRTRFLALAERLSRSGHRGIARFLGEGAEGLSRLDSDVHPLLLTLGESLMQLHPPALPEFFRSSPNVLSRIDARQLEVWFAHGVQLLNENKDGGMAYFRLESARSQEIVSSLSAVVELSRVKDVVRMYCRALAGTHVEIAPTQELVRKGIGWVAGERPTTEGTTVYLPAMAGRYDAKARNFGLLKVVATHQVAHLEYGSFDFEFEKPSTLFRDLRPRLATLPSLKDPGRETAGASSAEDSAWSTDMHRLFALFSDRRLALDIFTILEDARLDARVLHEYLGIRSYYRQVQHDSLEERPALEELPARESLVELLVRLSLGQQEGLVAPKAHAAEAQAIARVLRQVQGPSAFVEDVGEAALRIYAVLSQIPNEDLAQEEWEEVDPSQEPEEGDEDTEQILETLSSQMAPGDDEQSEPSQGQSYESPQQVDYRGDFKPELVQLINKLKEAQEEGVEQDAATTREMLEQLLDQSAEVDAGQGEALQNAGAFAANLMRSVGITPPPQSPSTGQGPFVHVDEEGGPLQSNDPAAYLYDEWDFRADDYKPRWCLVREKPVAEGESTFWYQTLQSHSALVAQIRRQFERVVPETFRKIRPLADGEDFDLDAVVDAMVDLRAGGYSSEKIYWRRNKVERDVAVLFLLDMSASTAEAIDENRRDDWDAPNDPVEYMLWLRTRRGDTSRRSYKRIIDLEKESIVLLIQALEALGDQYGIYGFSGYGRENVEFYVIKDLQETLTDQVRRRIDRVAPLHATRMGPAIRHATTLLDRVAAKTKVLFLISDGRPQDRGYSREGVEKEYAVHDTHQALVEARRKDITPFCLTVDRTGHDYLKAMCGDMGYEVLAEISALPQRLPELYRRLTV